MRIHVKRSVDVSNSPRARQLEGMFDVPRQAKCELEWNGELPIEDKSWNVGLIVGPSGCGKSTILGETFGTPTELEWQGKSVVDDFDSAHSMRDIAGVCQAVGFNTIPAWLRPYAVLSNGERFRVDLARRLLESKGLITVDEFTSVVDRQVAQIGAHAVQKFVRRQDKQFVAASCHYDIVDWLQPDWVFEPATMGFQWRSVRRRPELEVVIGRVPYSAWSLFAPFHYMSAALNKTARCFGLWVEGRLAAFCGILNQPHPKVRDIVRVSRVVTLPDWQGLGLAMILVGKLGAAYKSQRKRLRNYPAHPSFAASHSKSRDWTQKKALGTFSSRSGATSTAVSGGRPCAVFEYCGATMPQEEAKRLLAVG